MFALLAVVFLGQVGLGIDRTLPPAPPKAVSCMAAADPAIDSATQEKSGTAAGIDTFVIHVSVINRGKKSQSTKTRQIISVYHNDERIARMPIPALESGEAYAMTTKYKRSADAGADSTTLLFRLGGLTYAPGSVQDCNERDNSFRLTF